MTPEAEFLEEASSHILHPSSRRLFSHWEALRAERAFPKREDFTFGPIKDLLPDLVVLDKDYLRKTFKYRLAGSRACALWGYNLTSCDVLAGWDSFEKDVIGKNLDIAFNQFQPVLFRLKLSSDSGLQIVAEMILMPVQMRNSKRMQLLGGLFPFRALSDLGPLTIISQELASARVIWTEHSVLPVSAQHRSPEPRGDRTFQIIAGGKT